MTDLEFGSEPECVAFLFARPLIDKLPEQLRSEIVCELASMFKAPNPELPSEGGFAAVVGRWVIRDDDLKLFEELIRALTAAAGASFLDPTKLVAPGVGVAVAAVSIFRNIWRSAAQLSQDDLVLLMAVTNAKGRIELSELATVLKPVPRRDGSVWTDENVQRGLDRLEKFPTRTGLKKFLSRDSEGKWGPEGV
jgi:hypothetical protein